MPRAARLRGYTTVDAEQISRMLISINALPDEKEDGLKVHCCGMKGDIIMNSDLLLRANIEAELDFEPSIDAANIGVSVKDGIATLTGTVASYAQKLVAEKAAGRVKGVRAVAEEIEVQLPFESRHDDAEIARRVAGLLNWTVNLPPGAVHVKVEKGWVTISGEVEWRYQKHAVINVIRKLKGVVGLNDLLQIRPKVGVSDIRERIIQAYLRNAELDSAGVRIAVDGGTVILSGAVRAWNDRRVAENVVWATPGVTNVIDNLAVF
jgi:osmotically-inducible protein OsmY